MENKVARFYGPRCIYIYNIYITCVSGVNSFMLSAMQQHIIITQSARMTDTWQCQVIMLSIAMRLISMRCYRRLLFAGATLMAVFVVTEYVRYFSRLTQLSQSKPADLDEQHRVFYPWISYSGQILNGTKPPVYGLFVLLDIESSVSSREGARLIERFIDHYFDNCHQVRNM